MQKEEGNKLIAEFMGLKENSMLTEAIGKPMYKLQNKTSDARYDKSWDWLMSVVKKMNQTELWEEYNIGNLSILLVSADIKATYKAVIEFINQYNTEQRYEWARINLLPLEDAETRLRFAEGIESYDEDYIKEMQNAKNK